MANPSPLVPPVTSTLIGMTPVPRTAHPHLLPRNRPLYRSSNSLGTPTQLPLIRSDGVAHGISLSLGQDEGPRV